MSQRESLLNKIRALFSKTVENGATEAEALAALDKARAMMDAYEVTEEDLQLTKEQAAIIRNAASPIDKHNIRRYLATTVAAFCDCKAWLDNTTKVRGRHRDLTFCGQPSDIDFAEWLLDSLHQFVQGELTNHLLGDLGEPKWRRRKINGFVMGCCARICERLKELTRKSEVRATASSNALVVVKDHAVADTMKAAGIRLHTVNNYRRSDDSSRQAGYRAGDRANFGRPVGQRTAGYLE